MVKKIYELILKASDKSSVGRDEYVYRYGNTRDISMRIGKKGVSIRASIGYKEEPVDLLEKDLFKDGVRKALTLFLIKNSEPLRIGSMKAAVLPVPVCAQPRMSRLSRRRGIACSWMGVGFA